MGWQEKKREKEAPNKGLEPLTLRLKVWCSTDWANRAAIVRHTDVLRINTIPSVIQLRWISEKTDNWQYASDTHLRIKLSRNLQQSHKYMPPCSCMFIPSINQHCNTVLFTCSHAELLERTLTTWLFLCFKPNTCNKKIFPCGESNPGRRGESAES